MQVLMLRTHIRYIMLAGCKFLYIPIFYYIINCIVWRRPLTEFNFNEVILIWFVFSWSNGENHLFFNFLPGTPPNFHPVLGVNTDRALVAGAGNSHCSYRKSFDVSLPSFNSMCSALLKSHEWVNFAVFLTPWTSAFSSYWPYEGPLA